jgi:hypothetical protein
LQIELGGHGIGEFDRLNVDGDLWLDGSLSVSAVNGFLPELDRQFLIGTVGRDGDLSGEFSSLAEGDLVGTFGGTDLFITYQARGGKAVALYSLTSVPEPNACVLLAIGSVSVLLRRRRRDANSKAICA